MKINLILISAIVLGMCSSSSAQTRQPSTAIRPFLVKTKQSIDELEKKLSTDNKVEEMIGGPGMETRVSLQHDKSRVGADAELHDASDDVYYVLKGEATLVLGGKLENPREASPGEWKSKTIIGGQTIVVKEGDLIVVPRGTPHQRSVTGKGFSMILIKVFEDPIPAK
ncbi:MAG: cupin domain-containing protein [Candidatus Binatia bacterium]